MREVDVEVRVLAVRIGLGNVRVDLPNGQAIASPV